ncbi:acyltransferase domain-containing protein [Micromonospora sp. ALFpr18c]|uniref:type I polyketide synthase n=1 Tax=unclassified Micromonospora TaxID=2617518 RepID=UPI00124B7D0F|nr:type I polyketide synthase [Micromonospora sp. ALFpr18c]KAB1933412.1 acyltransferase domain-containing protein [Micromonospora sp. ALFpr18c]
MNTDHTVAIVGVAARYPGAGDVRALWANLVAGSDSIRHYTRAELTDGGADHEHVSQPGFVPARGVLVGPRNFDWAFFGYSRTEAASIDPQQRVFLECASAAIDDAGIDPTRFPGWIGVYAGADVVDARVRSGQGELATVIGREKDFLATRVAYKLGLRGPAVTVQTACSTSLTATHTAVRALVGHECDVALAGGVAIIPGDEWGYLYEEGGILSPDGRCRPFDEDAGGTVPSEGVGVVVLKRLSDALREGDRIVALIRGSAINNDGADKIGYTAPSLTGQSEVIRYAHHVGGTDPADVDYVEAHGTGTRIGDPIEVAALTDAWGPAGATAGSCGLGAIKSNIGHTGAAAGVAGLIKTALSLHHRQFVPTAHFRRPNPMLNLADTPFRVCTEVEKWPDRGTPLAAVSSFGVGGTNAHVILEAAPTRSRPIRSGYRVLAVSAATSSALRQSNRDLATRFTEPSVDVAEAAWTLAGRRQHRCRHTVVASTNDEAEQALRAFGETAEDGAPARLGTVAFVFPGQGALQDNAGASAYRLLAGFREHFDLIAKHISVTHGVDLGPIVAAEPPREDWFRSTVHQQVGLFTLGWALGRQLWDWGVRPAAMFGNSVGEYVAATLAGVWEPKDAASLVFARASAMAASPPGRMVMVSAPAAEVLDRIGTGHDVTLAVDGPGYVVLSGPDTAVDALLAADALAGLDVRPLSVRHAFHSPAMREPAEVFRAAVAANPSARPTVRLIANQTGGWADENLVTGPDYWAGQLLDTVRLTDGAATLLAADIAVFLELGPGTSMLGTLRRHPNWSPGPATIPLLGKSGGSAADGGDHRPGGRGERALLTAVGSLWAHGVDAAMSELMNVDESERPVRCSLPPHPLAGTSPDDDRPAYHPVVPRADTPTPGPATTGRALLAELWCTTLGVPSVAEADNFFALGGESLMVVSLLSRLRERTGQSVSPVEFVADPTFSTLMHLADRTDEQRPAAGIVPLHTAPAPSGKPVFLMADAFGTVLPYRELAALLDRSVYGVAPAAGDPAAGAPGGRIERLAADHVAAIRSVDPIGPYTVGGWSFGVVVAHEVARQLEALGATVDHLIGLDGFPPAPARPIGADPGYLAGSLRMLGDVVLGTGPLGARVRRDRALRARFTANITALLRYRPRPVRCAATVFLVATGEAALARTRDRLTGTYSGTVSTHHAAGDHWSMLTAPHVAGLAATLRARLSEQ